jgi:virulence factor Mce-like protein
MRTLEPANRRRIGLMGLIVTVLAVGVGQTLTSIPQLFAQPSYYGQFTDSGQLNKGDKVRIAGVDVGQVLAIKIDGDHVLMKFSTGSDTIGTESRMAIKTDTILGKKVLEIEPRGTQTLRPNGILPLGQSTTPYQIYDAFFDVTKAAAGWNIDTVKQSLNVLSQTIDQTYPHLSAALDGVAKFSDTIGKRDEQVTHLLAQANQVASILGDRSQQIDRLFVNSNNLLAAFNQRSQAIRALLGNVSALSTQVEALINNNPNLNHVLEQLRTVSDLLEKHKDDLSQALVMLGKNVVGLNEAVASGPYFKVSVSNLLPYWILQPWVDAAFKKRGLDPEDFWRSAGLPAAKCSTTGTSVAGGHRGSPGSGRPAWDALLVHTTAGTAAAAVESDAMRGHQSRPGSLRAQRAVPGVARYRVVAAEPQRPAPDPRNPDRRPAGPGPTRRAGHTCADRTGTPRGSHRAAGAAAGPRSGESRGGTTARTGGARTTGPAGTRQ